MLARDAFHDSSCVAPRAGRLRRPGARVSLSRLLASAGEQPTVFLPRVESHRAGSVLGLVSALVGLVAQRGDFPGHEALAWVALGGVLAGMLLHWRWKKADAGWQVDFAARRVWPLGLRGEDLTIAGPGWSIQVAPGERRTAIAIDLRHEDRGRVARLLDVPARGKSELTLVDQLADCLARRLDIPRSGLRL